MLPKIEQFIRERQYVTNVSPRTVEWYRQSLSLLPNESPDDADIKQVIIRLRNGGRKVTGVNCRLRAIKVYCRWAGLQTVVPRLREEQRVLPVFDTGHISRLLSWKPQTVPQCRIQTMVALLCDTGARIDEALSLRWADVDFDNLLLLLHGKGRKDRRVPMSLELRKRLYQWQRKQATDGFVFGTRTGEKQGHRNVLRDVKNLCRKLGFEPPARTLHAFRHTMATEYLRRGGNVAYLQRVLGHTTISMTMRYAHLATADLSNVHERFSLLGSR